MGKGGIGVEPITGDPILDAYLQIQMRHLYDPITRQMDQTAAQNIRNAIGQVGSWITGTGDTWMRPINKRPLPWEGGKVRPKLPPDEYPPVPPYWPPDEPDEKDRDRPKDDDPRPRTPSPPRRPRPQDRQMQKMPKYGDKTRRLRRAKVNRRKIKNATALYNLMFPRHTTFWQESHQIAGVANQKSINQLASKIFSTDRVKSAAKQFAAQAAATTPNFNYRYVFDSMVANLKIKNACNHPIYIKVHVVQNKAVSTATPIASISNISLADTTANPADATYDGQFQVDYAASNYVENGHTHLGYSMSENVSTNTMFNRAWRKQFKVKTVFAGKLGATEWLPLQFSAKNLSIDYVDFLAWPTGQVTSVLPERAILIELVGIIAHGITVQDDVGLTRPAVDIIMNEKYAGRTMPYGTARIHSLVGTQSYDLADAGRIYDDMTAEDADYQH